MESTFVTAREFDIRAKAVDDRFSRIETSLQRQADANAETAKNIALLAQQNKEDRDERKVKDQRVWALTLTFIGVMFTASIPFLVKAANVVFGTIN